MVVGFLGLGVFGQCRRGHEQRDRRTDEDYFRNPHLEFPLERHPYFWGRLWYFCATAILLSAGAQQWGNGFLAARETGAGVSMLP